MSVGQARPLPVPIMVFLNRDSVGSIATMPLTFGHASATGSILSRTAALAFWSLGLLVRHYCPDLRCMERGEDRVASFALVRALSRPLRVLLTSLDQVRHRSRSPPIQVSVTFKSGRLFAAIDLLAHSRHGSGTQRYPLLG
jgi:hypothetical protein